MYEKSNFSTVYLPLIFLMAVELIPFGFCPSANLYQYL